MTDELLVKLKELVQDSLIDLGIQPDYEKHLHRGLNALVKSFPYLDLNTIEKVTSNAASGKYGIPFKYVPAIIGTWFHKNELEHKEKMKGAI